MICKKNNAFGRIQGVSAWAICLMFFILPIACKKKSLAPPPPPGVAVAQPVRKVVTDYLEWTGNTQAIQTVQLVARVSGYLEKLFFQDGQRVKKGDLLFLIQQNTYQDTLRQNEAQILQLRAQLDYAEKQLIRYSNLLREKATSQENVDNWRYQRDSAQANLKAAEAARDLAKLNLDYTEVTAPFDGRIDRRLVDPGNLVGANGNTVLAELNQINPIYVYFNISDADLAHLMSEAHWIPGQTRKGASPVFLGLLNDQGYPHKGELDFASISLTPTTGTLLMRGVFPNPEGKIMPGLYARVRVPLKTRMGLLVPEVAIANDQQGSYVFIVNEKNTVERRNVKTGPAVDGLRAIDEGLKEEEWVIFKGLLKVAPGRQVTPEREGAAPPPGQGSPPISPKKKAGS